LQVTVAPLTEHVPVDPLLPVPAMAEMIVPPASAVCIGMTSVTTMFAESWGPLLLIVSVYRRVVSVLATVARFWVLTILKSARAAVELEAADVQLLVLFGSVRDALARATHPWFVSDAAPVAVVIRLTAGVFAPTASGPGKVHVKTEAL
jgi:hypothetical protein